MKKKKTWTREEILKIVTEAMEETNEVIKKQYGGIEEKKELEDKDIFDALGMLKDELLMIAFAEAIKHRLK